MKTIQKLTLGLLAVIATSTSTFASNIFLDVESGSAAHSGVITGTAQKIGAGTLVMSGANGSSLTSLEIDAGLVQFASTGNAGAQVKFGSAAPVGATGNLEVLAASADLDGDGIKDTVVANSVSLPAHVMVQSAQLKVGYGLTASLSSLTDTLSAAVRDAGASRTLTVAAETAADVAARGLSVGSAQPGVVLVVANMSASATRLAVNSDATVQVGGAAGSSSKLTSALHTINGTLELLTGASTGCVPGQTVIQSGGILKVAASITVPQYNSTSDLFGTTASDTLQFLSGAKLVLGAGSTWARDMAIGTAL